MGEGFAVLVVSEKRQRNYRVSSLPGEAAEVFVEGHTFLKMTDATGHVLLIPSLLS